MVTPVAPVCKVLKISRVYFLFGLVSAILIINLLPNYVAPFHRMLKINPY
jgi:hypothetical protein